MRPGIRTPSTPSSSGRGFPTGGSPPCGGSAPPSPRSARISFTRTSSTRMSSARRTRAVIVITESLARFTTERVGIPREKVTVVRYGLDELPAAWSVNPPLELAEGARVLLALGRLTPQKGPDVAVRAFASIRESVPEAVLVLAGEGPERERLEALGRELRLGDSLRLPGRAGDVAAWLRRAELLVHP